VKVRVVVAQPNEVLRAFFGGWLNNSAPRGACGPGDRDLNPAMGAKETAERYLPLEQA